MQGCKVDNDKCKNKEGKKRKDNSEKCKMRNFYL